MFRVFYVHFALFIYSAVHSISSKTQKSKSVAGCNISCWQTSTFSSEGNEKTKNNVYDLLKPQLVMPVRGIPEIMLTHPLLPGYSTFQAL